MAYPPGSPTNEKILSEGALSSNPEDACLLLRPLQTAQLAKHHPQACVCHYYDFEGDAIRADITYLRQDFSVCQPVPAPGKWPERQRYDYLVPERVLDATEVKQFQDSLQSTGGRRPKAGFAQRDAVLFALRELTGKDYEKARTPTSLGRR